MHLSNGNLLVVTRTAHHTKLLQAYFKTLQIKLGLITPRKPTYLNSTTNRKVTNRKPYYTSGFKSLSLNSQQKHSTHSPPTERPTRIQKSSVCVLQRQTRKRRAKFSAFHRRVHEFRNENLFAKQTHHTNSTKKILSHSALTSSGNCAPFHRK